MPLRQFLDIQEQREIRGTPRTPSIISFIPNLIRKILILKFSGCTADLDNTAVMWSSLNNYGNIEYFLNIHITSNHWQPCCKQPQLLKIIRKTNWPSNLYKNILNILFQKEIGSRFNLPYFLTNSWQTIMFLKRRKRKLFLIIQFKYVLISSYKVKSFIIFKYLLLKINFLNVKRENCFWLKKWNKREIIINKIVQFQPIFISLP